MHVTPLPPTSVGGFDCGPNEGTPGAVKVHRAIAARRTHISAMVSRACFKSWLETLCSNLSINWSAASCVDRRQAPNWRLPVTRPASCMRISARYPAPPQPIQFVNERLAYEHTGWQPMEDSVFFRNFFFLLLLPFCFEHVILKRTTSPATSRPVARLSLCAMIAIKTVFKAEMSVQFLSMPLSLALLVL